MGRHPLRRDRVPEYFKWTFGVELAPQKLGLGSYDEFAAPRSRAPGGESPQYRLRLAVFYALKRYALLRFFDEIGAYGKSKGVNVVAMPLNCSDSRGPDGRQCVWHPPAGGSGQQEHTADCPVPGRRAGFVPAGAA